MDRVRLSADVGGTFTDIAAFNERTGEFRLGKTLTTPSRLVDGIEMGVTKAGTTFSSARLFLHGTTTAINTILERTGARCALLTTQGFRDIYEIGRVNRPARPWLGMYSTEIDNKVVVIGISNDGPAARAELKAGDVILAVKGERISSQAAFYRKLWALGNAGVDVPLTVHHEGVTFDVVLASTDRTRLLKAPRLH